MGAPQEGGAVGVAMRAELAPLGVLAVWLEVAIGDGGDWANECTRMKRMTMI